MKTVIAVLLMCAAPCLASHPEEHFRGAEDPAAFFDGAKRFTPIPAPPLTVRPLELKPGPAAPPPAVRPRTTVPRPSGPSKLERRRRVRDAIASNAAVGVGGIGAWIGWGLAAGAGPWLAGLAALGGFYVGFTSVWAGYGMATDRDFLKGG